MANCAGKRIRSIRTGTALKAQQSLDHFLHLFFFRVAVADHRLLDLQCSVLGYRKIVQHGGTNGSPSRLTEHEGGFRIDVYEDLFDRDVLRVVQGNNLVEMVHDGLKAKRQSTVGCLDAAAAHVGKRAPRLIYNPKTGYAQTGVYAQDTDFCFLRVNSYASIMAVV